MEESKREYPIWDENKKNVEQEIEKSKNKGDKYDLTDVQVQQDDSVEPGNLKLSWKSCFHLPSFILMVIFWGFSFFVFSQSYSANKSRSSQNQGVAWISNVVLIASFLVNLILSFCGYTFKYLKNAYMRRDMLSIHFLKYYYTIIINFNWKK